MYKQIKNTKYNYLGTIDGLHIFEEEPTGVIKSSGMFSRYMKWFNRNTKLDDSLKLGILGCDRFVSSSRLYTQLKVLETQNDK